MTLMSRNEESPFRALTPLKQVMSVIGARCRNEESPFRALTHIHNATSLLINVE